MEKAKLLSVFRYTDTSWDERVPSTCIRYITPSGRFKEKYFYAWDASDQECRDWLEGKYRPRLTNLFGLLNYL